MIVSEWYHIPTPLSLGVIAAVLAVSIWLSIRKDDRERDRLAAAGATPGSNGQATDGNGVGTSGSPDGPATPAEVRGQAEE